MNTQMTFQGLNPQQLEAVSTIDGPLLVLAGAGSGKTRVVTCRIVALIEAGVPPSQILGLTFTNKAAEEMRARIETLIDQHVLICTFHSLGARILRESIHHLGYSLGFVIYDEEDVARLLKSCLKEIAPDEKLDVKVLRSGISRAKNGFQNPDAMDSTAGVTREEQLLVPVYRLYQEKLKAFNAVDFDDLLYLTAQLFEKHPDVLAQYQERWRYLLIDEYQDTNSTQYTLVRHLVAKSHNLCVVGDPDQSIYSWRGADIRNILEFERSFPQAKTVRLEHNYRSRSNILQAANHLISYNSDRLEKNLWSQLAAGEPIRLFAAETEADEAHFVIDTIRDHRKRFDLPLSEVAIFYRTNAQSRSLEDRFLASRLPYVIVGGISFYQRREIKDLLAYLRVVQSENDFIAFLRTINLPKRGIGPTTVNKLQRRAEQLGLSILACCERVLTGEDREVKLTANQKRGLGSYFSIIRALQTIKESCSIKELVMRAIEESGYLDFLKMEMETYQERKENLDELIAKAAEWEAETKEPTLEHFLEELSLKTSLDESVDERERISLMTIHNSKGLEFSSVFLVGLEEELFPHANARGSESALEEERRLCYVAMTRAKELLCLSYARFRYLWGGLRTQRPSRFLREIPRDLVKKVMYNWER